MSRLVLIADDNADNILLIKKILKRSGLDLEFIDVQSGRETLRVAIERVPEIILLDMKMPDIDGYKAAAELKSNDVTKHVPVIAITAQAMLGDKEKALQAGCNEYLTKPIDPVLLIDAIKKHLSEASGGEKSEQK